MCNSFYFWENSIVHCLYINFTEGKSFRFAKAQILLSLNDDHRFGLDTGAYSAEHYKNNLSYLSFLQENEEMNELFLPKP